MNKILFVCSRNKWRSRTAETIFKNHATTIVKSAGTEPSARIRLTAQLINWADLIFVMESKHEERIMEKFPQAANKQLIVLDIPDVYQYMDEELIEELRYSVSDYF